MLVGAGALVTEGKHFARGSLIVGVPARVMRQLSEAERQALRLRRHIMWRRRRITQ